MADGFPPSAICCFCDIMYMENNGTLQNFSEVSQIVLYQSEEDVVLEVKLDKNTIWLSQQQIADLFGVQKSAISKHMKNIFGTGELVREQVVSKMETTAADGKKYKVDYYNLDLILSVGYRVNSRNATQFRIWATSVLRDYLLRGYSINHQLVAMQERIDTRFSQLEERVSKKTKNRSISSSGLMFLLLKGYFMKGKCWMPASLRNN